MALRKFFLTIGLAFMALLTAGLALWWPYLGMWLAFVMAALLAFDSYRMTERVERAEAERDRACALLNRELERYKRFYLSALAERDEDRRRAERYKTFCQWLKKHGYVTMSTLEQFSRSGEKEEA